MKNEVRLIKDHKGKQYYKCGKFKIQLDELSEVEVVTPYGNYLGFVRRKEDDITNKPIYFVEVLEKNKGVISVDVIMNLRGYHLVDRSIKNDGY